MAEFQYNPKATDYDIATDSNLSTFGNEKLTKGPTAKPANLQVHDQSALFGKDGGFQVLAMRLWRCTVDQSARTKRCAPAAAASSPTTAIWYLYR